MKKLTDNLTTAFTQVINKIQLKASLQEIHRIDETAEQLRSFITWAIKVDERQNAKSN